MKRFFYLFTLLLFSLSLPAQSGLVSGELNVSVLPTDNGNGTFSLSGNFSDPKGQYFAADVTAGMCLWKGNSYFHIEDASANGATLTLTVEDSYGAGFLPTGVYSLGEQTSKLGLPAVSTSGDSNPALASPPDYAAKLNYILQRIDQQAGNGMFSGVNQDSAWQVSQYYILRRVDGILGEKGEFVLQDSSASNVGPVFQVIAGTGGNPALVQLGDGVEMPFLKVEGQAQSGAITAGFGPATYNLPTANPADGGSPAGQYVPVVDENGQLVGTGWLNAEQLEALTAGDYLYVSQKDGDNATAVRGQINRAWADPWAARDAAGQGDIIAVIDGHFILDTIGGINGNVFFPPDDYDAVSLFTDTNNQYLFAPDTRITSTPDLTLPIFHDTLGRTLDIRGNLTLDYRETPSRSMGRIGQYGNRKTESAAYPTRFYVEVDSLLAGKTDSWEVGLMHIGDIEQFELRGNYLFVHRSQIIGAASNDTTRNDFLVEFKQVYLDRSDATFSPGDIVGGSWTYRFEVLDVDLQYHIWYNNHLENGTVNFDLGKVTVRKDPEVGAVSDEFIAASYRQADRVMKNSQININIREFRSDSICLMDGVANRFAGNTNNKVYITGNYYVNDHFFFDNVQDANVGPENLTYVIDKCNVVTTNSHAIGIGDLTGVEINNSRIEAATGEAAVLLRSNAGLDNTRINNTILVVQDTTAAIQADGTTGDGVLISGGYSTNTLTDPAVTIEVVKPYGTVEAPVMSSFTVESDDAIPQTIADADLLFIGGGNDIITRNAPGGGVAIDLNMESVSVLNTLDGSETVFGYDANAGDEYQTPLGTLADWINDRKGDTLTITIPCFSPTQNVSTGTVGFWNCPDHLVGGQVVESQVAFYTAGSGGTVDVQLTDGILGYFGATVADGDRVETVNNGGTPLVLTTEQYLAVLVASVGATTPPDGMVVTLKVIAP